MSVAEAFLCLGHIYITGFDAGGLSGAPLKQMSTACVADMYRLTGGLLPIIAVSLL